MNDRDRDADKKQRFLLEGLPYGASMLGERKAAGLGVGIGVLAMAFGSGVFAVAWWFKLNWLLEAAFVLTLIAWMLLIISSAFWFVSALAGKIPMKNRGK